MDRARIDRVDDLEVDRCAVGKHAVLLLAVFVVVIEIVFRRVRRSGRQVAVAVLNQVIAQEFTRALEDRIDLLEEIGVAGELVMLPKVQAQPRAGHREEAAVDGIVRTGAAKDVGRMVDDPAFAAELFFGGWATKVADHLHEVDERTHRFRHVGRFGGPIVHLQVDIRMVVAAPGRHIAVAPNALQVGGKRGVFAGAFDQQIAAEVIVEFVKVEVFAAAAFDKIETVVDGPSFIFGRLEIQSNRFEDGFVHGDVFGFDRLIIDGFHRFQFGS